MDLASFLRAIFALALTLGLVGLAAVALRKYGPDAMARLAVQKKDRRMRVVRWMARILEMPELVPRAMAFGNRAAEKIPGFSR